MLIYFYLINPEDIDDDLPEYYLCKEIIEKFPKHLKYISSRHIKSSLKPKTRSKLWKKLIKNSIKSDKPVYGYLSAFRFKKSRIWHMTLYTNY